MITYLRCRSRLLMNISTAALLAALPSAMFVNVAMAQQVVVTEDAADGLIYDDITSFNNPGFTIIDDFSGVSIGNLTDGFSNTGNITGDVLGSQVSGDIGGDFTNSGNITGETGSGFNVGDTISGDVTNSGNIVGYSSGIYVYGSVSGDFTNTGVIIGTGVSLAVGVNDDISGDFINSGNIVGYSDSVGVFGSLNGDFTNTGVIMATDGDRAVEVNGDLSGDFVNTGDIIANGGLATYIGNFAGNLTTPVNQGVSTSEADIRGKTVTAYIDGFVADGTEWVALQANSSLTSDASQSIDDTSALMDVYIASLTDEELVLGLSAHDINEVAGTEAGDLGLLGAAAQLIEEREIDEDAGTPGQRALLDALYRQETSTGIAEVLADFSPSGSRGSAIGSFVANQHFIDRLASRLSGGGTGRGGAATFAMASASEASRSGSGQWWGEGFGGIGDLTNDGVVGGYDLKSAGVGFGVETDSAEGMIIGGAFAVAATNFDGSSSSGDIVSYMPAVYGKFQANDWYLSGVASGAFNQIDQSRFNTTASETLTADYSGGQANLRAEAGYDIKANGAAFTPFVAGTFGYVKTDAYDEQGGATALSVGSTSDTHILVEAGSRLSATHGATTFNAVAGWREDFGTLDSSVSASLQNSASFTSTYDINVSGFFGGVGFSTMTAQNFEFGAGVSGIIGSDYQSVDGQMTVKKNF